MYIRLSNAYAPGRVRAGHQNTGCDTSPTDLTDAHLPVGLTKAAFAFTVSGGGGRPYSLAVMETQQAIKERPILFSAPMVRAILNGSKTQTRRVVKGIDITPGNLPNTATFVRDTGKADEYLFGSNCPVEELADPFAGIGALCPYGQPGDRLWVREAFAGSLADAYEYRADNRDYGGVTPRWTPSIHMPRRASRILLEIVSVRVERLQAITEADAKAEGVEKWPDGYDYKAYGKHAGRFTDARSSFASLWKSINGPESWEGNPWVWVVEFKRIEPC
jgi:hypothetical protein